MTQKVLVVEDDELMAELIGDVWAGTSYSEGGLESAPVGRLFAA